MQYLLAGITCSRAPPSKGWRIRFENKLIIAELQLIITSELYNQGTQRIFLVKKKTLDTQTAVFSS